MSNKNNKDTYDKLIGGATYGDLFSESGFDEMQKAKNYEIGFKLFRAFFWIMYIVSIGIMMAAVGVENALFACIGFGVLVLCTVFYLLYAAKASAAGVMNPKFAAQAAKKSYLVWGIIILTLWLIMLVCGNVQLESAGIYIIISVMYIGQYICSRRNMKVLEKMLKENEDE